MTGPPAADHPLEEDGHRPLRSLVVVGIGDRRVAFVLDDVVEVQRMVAVTPLPTAPEVVEGVIDLRGRLVPVVDIRARFGLPARGVSPDQHLVVVRAGERTVAVRVDTTLGVRDLRDDDLETATAELPGVRHLTGIARDDDGITLVHDLAALLSWQEAEQLEHALARDGVAT